MLVWCIHVHIHVCCVHPASLTCALMLVCERWPHTQTCPDTAGMVQHKCGVRSNLTASGVDGCLPKFNHLWERHNRPKDAWRTGGLPPTVPHWMPVAVKCTSFHPSSIYSTLPPMFATGRSTQQLLLCGGVRGRPCAVTPLLQMYVYSSTVWLHNGSHCKLTQVKGSPCTEVLSYPSVLGLLHLRLHRLHRYGGLWWELIGCKYICCVWYSLWQWVTYLRLSHLISVHSYIYIWTHS